MSGSNQALLELQTDLQRLRKLSSEDAYLEQQTILSKALDKAVSLHRLVSREKLIVPKLDELMAELEVHRQRLDAVRLSLSEPAVDLPSLSSDDDADDTVSAEEKWDIAIDASRLPPAPLSPYEQHLVQARQLIKEAEHIAQCAMSAITNSQSIAAQFAAYLEIIDLPHSGIQEERLKTELETTIHYYKDSKNVFFEQLDAINFLISTQSTRINFIKQRLQELYYQIAKDHMIISGNLAQEDIRGERQQIEIALQQLKQSAIQIETMMSDKTAEKLNAQLTKIQKWQAKVKYRSNDDQKPEIDEKIAACEIRSLQKSHEDLQEFVTQQLLHDAEVLHQRVVQDEKMLLAQVSKFREIGEEAIETEAQLMAATQRLADLEQQTAAEFSTLFALEKSLADSEEHAHAKLIRYSSLLARVKLHHLDIAEAYVARDRNSSLKEIFKKIRDTKELPLQQYHAEVLRVKNEISRAKERLQRRREQTREQTHRIESFLQYLPAAIPVDFKAMAQPLVDQVMQAPDASAALQCVIALRSAFARFKINPWTELITSTQIYIQEIDTASTHDLSADKRQELLRALHAHLAKINQNDAQWRSQMDGVMPQLAHFEAISQAHVVQMIQDHLLRMQQAMSDRQPQLKSISDTLMSFPLPSRSSLIAAGVTLAGLIKILVEEEKILKIYQDYLLLIGADTQQINDLISVQVAQIKEAFALERVGNASLQLVTEQYMQTATSVLAETEEKLNAAKIEIESQIRDATKLGVYYFVTQDDDVVHSPDWQDKVAFAKKQLFDIELLLTKINGLADLDQLPARHRAISFVDQQNELLFRLQAYKAKLSLMVAGDFIALTDREKLKAHTDHRQVEDIPSLHSLVSDSTLISSYCDQQVAFATQMAQHFFAISKQLFSAIPRDEFFNVKPGSFPHITAMTNQFNQLCLYVQQDILKYQSIDARTMAMERWLLVMEKCFALYDYHTLFAIFSAFEEPCIFRLNSTKMGLSEKGKQRLMKFKEWLSDPVLGKVMLAEQDQAIIPHLGVFLAQIKKMYLVLNQQSQDDAALEVEPKTLQDVSNANAVVDQLALWQARSRASLSATSPLVVILRDQLTRHT